jgi:hypothetical protein
MTMFQNNGKVGFEHARWLASAVVSLADGVSTRSALPPSAPALPPLWPFDPFPIRPAMIYFFFPVAAR